MATQFNSNRSHLCPVKSGREMFFKMTQKERKIIVLM